jgi:hypothetical protein
MLALPALQVGDQSISVFRSIAHSALCSHFYFSSTPLSTCNTPSESYGFPQLWKIVESSKKPFIIDVFWMLTTVYFIFTFSTFQQFSEF